MSDAAELPDDTPVHRIGGRLLGNLRLKPSEKRFKQPGFSVLLGGTPHEAGATIRGAYPAATRLHDEAKVIASSTVGRIRAAGFEVLAVASDRLANHGRVVHSTGLAGFSDEKLNALSQVFQETTGC